MLPTRLSKLGTLTLVALATATAMPATAAHASAAGSCYASSCTGREPNGTTCASDATSPRTIRFAGRLVELRYSPSCRAAWARISGAQTGDQAYVQNTKGQNYTATVRSGSDTHTLMVNDAGIQSWACGWTVNGDNCTGSY